MPSLRIALFGDGSSPHVYRLADSLAQRGHTVAIISEGRHGPFPTIAGVAFHTYDHAAPLPRRIHAVRELLRRFDPDVVNSHYVNIGGFMASASGFHPHVMTAWGSDIWTAPHYTHAQYIKTVLALRSADWVLAPAKALRQEASRIARGLPHSSVWQWGVDLTFFKPHDQTAARRRMGRADVPTAYSPRAMQPLYNQETLLRAWPAVLQAVPGAQLVLKRLAPEADYETRLRRLAAELKIETSLVWEEPVPFPQLPETYAAADVVVSLPSTDGTPATVLETLACGVPVVACDVPALREWIVPRVNGWLAAPQDPAAVAAATIEALRLPAAAKRAMAQSARKTVADRADKAMHLAALEDLFVSLLSRKGFSAPRSLRNITGL